MRALLLLLFVSTSAFATTAEEWVADADQGYHEVLLGCPNRIWPGMDWSRTQMLLTSDKMQKAWLVSARSRPAEFLQVSEVPPVAFKAPYTFLEFRGVTTVTVSLDLPFFDENTSPFTLAVHEMFHHAGQKGWKTGGGSRGTLVPMDYRPRYIRAEMLLAMRSELERGAGLGPAADWYNEWSNGYAHEVLSSTDGYEGTAAYVETMAALFQKNSCAVSDAGLRAAIKGLAGKFNVYPGGELDSEGYPTGSLAGFLLDLQGIEWKSQMPAGITPTAILLGGKATGVPATDAALAQKYESAYAALNAGIDAWRLPFEQKLASTEYVRVAVPGAWVQGAYSPKGFYIPAANPQRLYTPLNGEHKFFSAGGEFITVADGVVGLNDQAAKECADAAWYLLVAKADLVSAGGIFSVQTSELQMQATGTMKTGAGGFDYLCVQP